MDEKRLGREMLNFLLLKIPKLLCCPESKELMVSLDPVFVLEAFKFSLPSEWNDSVFHRGTTNFHSLHAFFMAGAHSAVLIICTSPKEFPQLGEVSMIVLFITYLG